MTNIIKYIHGWQNVGKQKKQFNNKTTEENCTQCKQTEEQHHYLVCKHPTWNQIRNKHWKLVKKQLIAAGTHKQIIAILSHIVNKQLQSTQEELQCVPNNKSKEL